MLDRDNATQSWAKIYNTKVWEYYLTQRDPTQRVRTRPSYDEEPWFKPYNWMIDYATYTCPVRKQMCFAFEDVVGRYWLHDEWHLAGAMYRDDTLDNWEEGSSTLPYGHPARADGVGTRPKVAGAPRLTWDMLQGWQMADIASMTGEIAGEFLDRIDGDGGLVIPNIYVHGAHVDAADFAYLAVGMPPGAYFMARAQAIKAFDDVYGVGTFMKSAKAARDRHLIRISALRKRWEKKHIGMVAREWEGPTAKLQMALTAPDPEEIRNLVNGAFVEGMAA